MLDDYRDAMGILLKRSEYTDGDIVKFQNKIDNFFGLCGAIWGRKIRSYNLHKHHRGKILPVNIQLIAL
jgi:hypothetical protein